MGANDVKRASGERFAANSNVGAISKTVQPTKAKAKTAAVSPKAANNGIQRSSSKDSVGSGGIQGGGDIIED